MSAARIGRMTAAALLVLLCALMAAALVRMPPAWLPTRVDVTLAAGGALQLGGNELAAAGAPGGA
ncbi:hypothetical protein G4G28_10755 [Massilia sp. Dwa41.01b]|nr:hypothetical protein [Massilia sp. Dwa41.01b]QNA88844.1 hypothetical protein G4G28_10755 [Massilia sp. Dwa41.01b]